MIKQILSRQRMKMLGASFLLGVLIIAVLGYVDSDFNQGIRFSREPGFYEESFYLEIEGNKGCTLYYTLDGSKPGLTSQPYTEPILIEDVSYKENVYSAHRDISPELYKEERYQERLYYTVPEAPVDKCNVVRVAAYDRENKLVSEETALYFIGFQNKSGYDGMMTASIVTEPENLFDYEKGIYVLGEEYDRYIAGEQPDFTANFWRRGREWERPAAIDLFDADGNLLFASPAGIRIQGYLSRVYPQKGFKVYAREEYGGSSRFVYDLFGNGIGPHKFSLTSCGQDSLIKIRDYIVQATTAGAGLNFATMKMYPCVLFLNGEYWGVYYIAESYDEFYVADHYGVAEDDIVMIKNGALEEGTEEDIELYQEMMDFIQNNDMTDDANFEKACELVDIDSFVDYYATEIYIGNSDWPENNMALWRTREKHTINNFADGRWRFMLFDTNVITVFMNSDADYFAHLLETDGLFASLIQNAAVQRMFRERIAGLENGIYRIENIDNLFYNWYGIMNVPLQKNVERYYNVAAFDEISNHLDAMKLFIMERPGYVNQQMNSYIGNGD